MIVYFPGSFKPPHRGHFEIVEKLSKMSTIDKIYIVISKKSRTCNINNKINNKIDKYEFTAEQSKKIWELYISSCLSIKQQEKIHVTISFFPSPLYQVYRDIERKSTGLKTKNKTKNNKIKTKTKIKEKFLLIKSKKNAENKRFNMFKPLIMRKISIKTKVISTVDHLSASDLRCLLQKSLSSGKITEKDLKEIKKYIPKKLPKSEIKSKWLAIMKK